MALFLNWHGRCYRSRGLVVKYASAVPHGLNGYPNSELGFTMTRVDSASLTEDDQSFSTGLRIFYEAGPGNVSGTYRSWKDDRDDSSIVAIGYSHLFYDVCRRNGYEALVVANNRD